MDEDDFKDRPRTLKQPRLERPSWEQTLLEQVRVYILRESEDFVLRGVIVEEMRLTAVSITVGRCLAALAREGLLIHKAVDPKDYPEVFLGTGYLSRKVTWYDGKWIWGDFPVFRHKGFGNYKRNWGIRRDSRKFRSKKAVSKAQRKNPAVPVKPEEWDGRAYFIVRGVAFKAACDERGIPHDPKADWTCPQCQKKNRHTERGCCNYGHCTYQRPHEKYWPPPPVQSVVCKRCGLTLPQGKKAHSDRACNEAIVRGVMES